MKYNEALSLWGSEQLRKTFSHWGNFENITTRVETIEGRSCCGCSGEYPCMYDSSSETNIVISGIGTNKKGETQSLETRLAIDEYSDDFNLARFLEEILELAGGVIRND